jgi:pimeloyl-ACP methyl ester carboxylesterase
MPYVNSEGVRIHYEVEGQGPPLVLMHGFFGNLKMWRSFGYVKELKGDYRLILLDARSHGDSDKPHDPQAYTPELMTGDVVAVLNDLSVEKANYWGYSMGGGIGFQLTRYHPSRFNSYILGGQTPYQFSEAHKQLPNLIDTMLKLGIEKGPEAAIAFREKTLGPVESDEIKQRMRNNDYKALYILGQTRAWHIRSDRHTTDDMLSRIAAPCLLYAGERDAEYDGMKEAAKHIPDASFISIPGLNHLETYERSDPILPHVKRFLSRVTG